MPAFFRPSMSRGSAEKLVPEAWKRGLFGAGFSKLAAAMSAPLMRSRTTPASPVRFVYGVSQPSGEQFLQRPVMVAVPPSNGEVGALVLEGQVDAAVEHDVAAGEQGPGRRRIEGVGSGRGGQAGRQRPVRERLHPVDAEERCVAPRQRPDLWPDRVRAQEGEPLAVLGEVGGEGLRVRGEDEARGVGRAIGTERAQDRVGLALDELERGVAVAGAGQDGLQLLRAGRGRRRPEVGDRDDRDVGELGGRGRRRGCLAGGRGRAVFDDRRRRSRSVGASRSRPRTTGQRWRSTPRPGGRPGRRQARPRARR